MLRHSQSYKKTMLIIFHKHRHLFSHIKDKRQEKFVFQHKIIPSSRQPMPARSMHRPHAAGADVASLGWHESVFFHGWFGNVKLLSYVCIKFDRRNLDRAITYTHSASKPKEQQTHHERNWHAQDRGLQRLHRPHRQETESIQGCLLQRQQAGRDDRCGEV